jgi:hypothetical protein
MSVKRSRLIIGERPAPDLIECLHCRRRWDASLQKSLQCIVCKTVWDGPPDWDQSAVIRKMWIIESRWRIGFGHGHWQYAAKLSAELSADEIEAVLEGHRKSEALRVARLKPTMTFEYRAVEKLIEVLRNRTAQTSVA